MREPASERKVGAGRRPVTVKPASLSRDAAIQLALGLQRVLVVLPWAVQRRIGVVLGAAAYLVAGRRRRIAQRNLELCFPELTGSERRVLLRRHFRALGIGLMELGMAWWASDERLQPLVRLEGLQHLESARQDHRPIILVAGHFTTMDLVCRLLGLYVDYDGVQRPFGHAALDERLAAGRLRAVRKLHSKFDLRAILSALAAGRTLWIAIDQAQQGSRPVMAPFFGEPAPTTGSPARLAARSGATVLPVAGWREADGRYRIRIDAPLEDFPVGDAVTDATRLNALIESQVRAVPEQYYWIHRRFKADPAFYDEA